MPTPAPQQALAERLHDAGYLVDEALATTLWLAGELQRPLLVEGDAGVGKTALATALARAEGRQLVRLQCHEGLDLSQATYEWNYGRQLLAIRLHETGQHPAGQQRLQEADLFGRDYLLPRPLLQAISTDAPCVLLIDEIDRADEAFEAFLLELLADYQITVPELGTVRARHVPQVVLTSNGSRELSDALRQRCLYHWLDYPTLAREMAIVRATLPQAETLLVEQAVALVQRLRREDLTKIPGIAETLDWIRALHRLGHAALPDDPAALLASLGCLLKTRDDRFLMQPERLRQLIEGRRSVGVAERAWRAIACHGRGDWLRWPELFERYWHPQRLIGRARLSGQTRPARDMRQLVQDLQQALASSDTPPGRAGPTPDAALAGAGVAEDDPGWPLAQGGATRTDALHDRSLAMWLPQDLAQLQQLAERIAERLRRRLTRRWHDQRRGCRLDLRRTLRASLRTGGLPLAPVWRAPRRERPRLFILVDVSRSMQTHAQLFLRIARALVGPAGARVFVFHTRLAEITPLLQRDSSAVQEKVNAVTAGFGGGTRIATSVDDFSRVHARAQLQRGARVWILSDGFDADPPQRLAEALARVRARGARTSRFQPTIAPPASQAMQAVHDQRGLVERWQRLASLRDLAAALPQWS